MIYLIIVNYYSTDLIKGLLTSIPPAYCTKFRVIIVNNSPADRAIGQLAAAKTDLTLITAETNLGFGAGCNRGIMHVYQSNPQALIWLLNPDTTIEPDAVAYIMDCFQQNPDLAILGTRIRDSQGNIWFSEGKFNPWIGSLPHQSIDNGGRKGAWSAFVAPGIPPKPPLGKGGASSPPFLRWSLSVSRRGVWVVPERSRRGDPATGRTHERSTGFDHTRRKVKIIPCRWVSGCSMILNLARFNHCPSFDPHYFLYYEDNDFCEGYYQQGYQIAVTEDVLVTHLVSATTHKDRTAKFRHATYSKLYFLKQHSTVLALWLNMVYLLAKVMLLLPRDRASALGRWQGLQRFILSYHERS